MIIKTIQLTDDPSVTLTIYVQEPSSELSNMTKRPGILILPGGGYHFCSDREAEPIALVYLKEGYNAFVLRYSLKEKSKFPRPLNDAELALELIRKNTDEWHTLSDKIACIGFSAGGHLAAMLATKGRVRPNAVILAYAAVIRKEKYGWDYPTAVVDKDTPEAFIFHTFEDSIVPVDMSLYFANEMNKNGIPFEIHVFKKGTHGLSLGNHNVSNDLNMMVEEDTQVWIDLSIKWLNHLFDVFKSKN